MRARSRYALALRAARSAATAPLRVAAALAVMALAACATPTAPPPAVAYSTPPSDPRALAADLDARLDALRKQSEPASDEVISSLERTLREQREKRARAIVAAGTTSVVPTGAATAPLVAAPAPVAVAAAATPLPVKSTKASRAAAKAASAAAARAQSSTVTAAGGAGASTAVVAVPPPAMVYSTAATVMGPEHTPMSRTPESRLPVSELYERARGMEVRLQTTQAIELYREASQRGHAPSSQRLMELYADGAPGVARDYRVAVFFKERAVQQGVSFDPLWRR